MQEPGPEIDGFVESLRWKDAVDYDFKGQAYSLSSSDIPASSERAIGQLLGLGPLIGTNAALQHACARTFLSC